MIPVRGYTMLEFLYWLIEAHPDIETIRGISMERLLGLADEFDNGDVQRNADLARKWEEGFRVLLDGYFDLEDYEEARQLAKNLAWQRYRDRMSPSGPSIARAPDPVGRYRSVPLHGIFMYSTEDTEFSKYIDTNWRALDRMSGDSCDMYPSIDQLTGLEDVYDVLNSQSKLVRGMSAISLSDLPGIMFWDNQGTSEYISFVGRDNPGAIRDALRTIFECIRRNAIIQNIVTARMRLECSTARNTVLNPQNIACCLTVPSGRCWSGLALRRT